MPVLANWIRELRYDLELAERRINALEGRCQRLETAVRRQALARRHWITNGHRERV